MPDKKNPTKLPTNSDDYIRRSRKNAAKRQLERAAKRKEIRTAPVDKTENPQDKAKSSQKHT
jgi:hypothetical protein